MIYMIYMIILFYFISTKQLYVYFLVTFQINAFCLSYFCIDKYINLMFQLN